mmetsp:Transcript_3791/g.4203  ORF Transcript_3791/g.4203 Transcript_3791/m.4203 type:complete len:214 (-) Transcript_3791:173-814(-)
MGDKSSKEAKPTTKTPGYVSRDHTEPLKEYQSDFNIALIGNRGVGKRSLVHRFVDDTYTNQYPEGEEKVRNDSKGEEKISIKEINIKGEKIRLHVCANQSRPSQMINAHTPYRGYHGILLLFDITRRESFHYSMWNWLQEIQRYGREDAQTILVGTKCDLTANRVIGYDTAKEVADGLEMSFIETSAKNSTNVTEAFELLVSKIMAKYRKKPK